MSKNIHQRVLSLMGELSYIKKEDKKVNNQYTFVAHDSVSAAIHPLLVKHGIAMIPTVEELNHERISYQKWDFKAKEFKEAFGNLVTAKVKVSFVNPDDPKDQFSVQYFGQGMDDSDKAVGKAVSYACKYAMLKVFCLETGDEPEQDALSHMSPPARQESNDVPARKLTTKEIEMVLDLGKTDNQLEWIYKQPVKFGFKSLADFKVKSFDSFYQHLKDKMPNE